MRFSRQLAVIAVLLLQSLPIFADDTITSVMSPIASYQSAEDFNSEVLTHGGVLSPFVSYQYLEDFGSEALINGGISSLYVSYQFQENFASEALTKGGIVSPIASYQFIEWPGNGILNLQSSPVVSYFWQFGNSSGPVVLHGRVTDTNGTPLFGATVTAMIFLSPVAQATTDANGNYQMPSLSAGAYDLSAWDTSHQTSMRELTLNANTAEQNFRLNLLPPTPAMQQVNRTAVFQFPPIGSLGEVLKIFNGSVFTDISPGNAPSPNLKTIVLTHGWNSNPTVWAQSMASNMVAKGVSANLLAYDWQYAAASPYPPEENTPAEGVLLGQSLQTELGASYSQPIHFIGHSLGTIVNASAANYLHGDKTAQQDVSPTPWRTIPIHVTLLDEAEAASLLGGVEAYFDGLTVRLINLGVPLASPPSGASLGWKSPIPVHSTWADNYISKFGFSHLEAVNVDLGRAILIPGAVAQHAYSYQWYGMTVANPAGCVLGFQRSYEARAASLSAFDFPPSASDFPPGVLYAQTFATSDQLVLNYQPTISQIVGTMASAVVQGVQATAQTVGNVTATIASAAQNEAQLVAQGFNYVSGVASQDGQALVNFFDSAVLHVTLTTTPPAASNLRVPNGLVRPMGGPSGNDASSAPPMIWLPIQIPANASVMAFDFTVNGDPVDDWLVCGIGTNNLFSFEAKYIPTNQISASRLIDVTAWAGTTNELFFGFLGGTSTNATLAIDNIRFYSLQPPSLQAQMSGGNLILSWPLSASDYALETTTNLADTNSWTTLTNFPAIVNLQNAVTNSNSGGAQFYRLKK
jgi:pimeloyl-ACP methyl ester carboxylesterase